MQRRNKILLIILATFVSLIVFLLDFKHLILTILFKKNLMISTKKLS